MKRLLLPLLAALALPTAVNAESYWLLISAGNVNSHALEKIEMKSMEQCKEQGEAYKDSGIYGKSAMSTSMRYVCLKGK